MESQSHTYCRFCAEVKSSVKLLDLETDEGKLLKELTTQLTFLNASYINLSDDSMPKTICLICYDSLKNAYNFLTYAETAQNILVNLLGNRNTRNTIVSADNVNDYNNFLSDCEKPTVDEDMMNHAEEIPCSSMPIKQELKEEIPDEPYLDLGIDDSVSSTSHKDYEEPNIDDILSAAISNRTSNVTIYAKEIKSVARKDIKSWRDYSWTCGLCDALFFDLDSLRSHAKDVHKKCSTFRCAECEKYKGNNFSSFVRHVRKHWKNLRNRCIYCDTHDKESIRKHTKGHYRNSQEPCLLCGEILTVDTLPSHIQEFTPHPKKLHRRSRRKPGTPITLQDLTCHVCNKAYKHLNGLRDHVKLHTGERKREYTCDRCGKMYYNKGTLTSHIMSHDKVRPHVCKICKQSFKYPNMLRRHIDIHSGVKPFSCEQCGRQFRLSHQLKAHKIIHTDNMPYACRFCNKSFRFRQIMINHEKQHTGDKPYTCEICGMDFVNWSNYNKHSKRRHNTDLSKKKITPEGVFPVNPETGQIVQVEETQGMIEWRNRVMLPCKRGKKKAIKEEQS